MARNGGAIDPAWAPPAVDDPFEMEDEDLCPLCMEELDVSDLNFRPCPCGYRICRFCWHHIKEDLNKRCPGCRKEYDDSVVEFKPMKADELKKLQQAKKQRDKERKDLELMNRKHLANVRVKQRNQVHVQGLTTKMANEDTLAQLRSNELFTQYGKIMKMFMSRRIGATNLHTPDARFQHVNLYINYSKNTEALACIAGLDGTTLPDGHRVKACLGSTKYCPSFLRGMKCHNDNCTGAHEMAEEVDGTGSAAREEMSTARHAQKESEHRNSARSNSTASQPSSSVPAAALPASASWANRANANAAGPSGSQPSSPAVSTTSLPATGSPLVKQLSRNATAAVAAKAPTHHPLPPKPRQASFSSAGPPTPTHPLPSNPAAAAPSSSRASPPLPVAKETASEKPVATAAPSEAPKAAELPPAPAAVAGPSAATASEAASVTVPPGLAPPPGLGPSAASPGPTTPSLPPGLSLPLPASSLPPDAPPQPRTPSLPPGLYSDPEPVLNGISSPGSFAFNLGMLSPDEKGKQKEIIADPEHMVSFASTLGLSSLSLTDPISIEPSSAGLISRSSSLGGSAFLPLGSTPYHGSFDPFADTDARGADAGGTPPPTDETRGRGSRFGFAKRDSASGFSFGDSPGSTLRTSLGGPPGLERSDSARPPSAIPEGTSRFASPAIGKPAAPAPAESGSSTPDASVLFPGVNLAASYSANAMPAALAARGLKSPPGSRQNTTSSFSSAASTPDSSALGYARLPTNFHPSMRTASPVSGGGYMGMQATTPGSGADLGYGMANNYQDPAILNMRMAPNGAPYGPPGLAGPTDINGYSHYPMANNFAGMARGPYGAAQQQQQDHLQQQYGLQQQHHHHHPGMAAGRQASYFGNPAAVAAGAGVGMGSLQRDNGFYFPEGVHAGPPMAPIRTKSSRAGHRQASRAAPTSPPSAAAATPTPGALPVMSSSLDHAALTLQVGQSDSTEWDFGPEEEAFPPVPTRS